LEQNENLHSSVGYSDTRIIISKVAYLIGVDKRHFDSEYEPPLAEVYAELDLIPEAAIIRALCRLRTAIERNFASVNQLMQREYRTLHSMPELIPADALKLLSENSISIVKKSITRPVEHIIDINRHIGDRINNCARLFPMWLDFSYIRELFLMPDGLCVEGTKKAAELYYRNRLKYPYQVYINWNPEDCGNILYNDRKFLTLLYKMHGDSFDDISRVSDVGEAVRTSIDEFVGASHGAALVVDCENSDPYKLAAAIKGFNELTLSGIGRIFLYNDVHASSAWRLFEGYTRGIPCEHIMTERLKESKSLVDIKLSCGVSKEFYKNGVDSFIIASSDSDYWGLIDSMKEAKFLVMAEREKCGSSIRTALDGRDIYFCYIDDFCTADEDGLKIAALAAETKRYLSEHISLNVEVMLDEVYKRTRVHMSDAEYKGFYEKYVKTMQLVIDKNGDVSIEIRTKQ